MMFFSFLFINYLYTHIANTFTLITHTQKLKYEHCTFAIIFYHSKIFEFIYNTYVIESGLRRYVARPKNKLTFPVILIVKIYVLNDSVYAIRELLKNFYFFVGRCFLKTSRNKKYQKTKKSHTFVKAFFLRFMYTKNRLLLMNITGIRYRQLLALMEYLKHVSEDFGCLYCCELHLLD
jgi:hypothetical protein